jgi:hypothetical protein
MLKLIKRIFDKPADPFIEESEEEIQKEIHEEIHEELSENVSDLSHLTNQQQLDTRYVDKIITLVEDEKERFSTVSSIGIQENIIIYHNPGHNLHMRLILYKDGTIIAPVSECYHSEDQIKRLLELFEEINVIDRNRLMGEL